VRLRLRKEDLFTLLLRRRYIHHSTEVTEEEQYLLVIDTFIIYESIGGSGSTLSGVVGFVNSGLSVSGNQGIYTPLRQHLKLAIMMLFVYIKKWQKSLEKRKRENL
jgi:hypothetical protein